MPRLHGAHGLEARVLDRKAVIASWRLGDGATLTIATNLDAAPVPLEQPSGRLIFASADLFPDALPGHCTAAFLDISA
jgi:maltooligosyltrehalose trehalohydrolase